MFLRFHLKLQTLKTWSKKESEWKIAKLKFADSFSQFAKGNFNKIFTLSYQF